ncbi:MAG: FeoA family protein [Desulforhopalus sp.]
MHRNRGKKNGCCFVDKVRNCFSREQCNKIIAPLSERARTGRVKVCKVTGDRKICARMASMGLYPGVEADIICSENGSQCLLKVNGGTISLDSDVSNNIFVTSI